MAYHNWAIFRLVKQSNGKCFAYRFLFAFGIGTTITSIWIVGLSIGWICQKSYFRGAVSNKNEIDVRGNMGVSNFPKLPLTWNYTQNWNHYLWSGRISHEYIWVAICALIWKVTDNILYPCVLLLMNWENILLFRPECFCTLHVWK